MAREPKQDTSTYAMRPPPSVQPHTIYLATARQTLSASSSKARFFGASTRAFDRRAPVLESLTGYLAPHLCLR